MLNDDEDPEKIVEREGMKQVSDSGELDKIIMKYGGRVYLAKDARIKKRNFELGYNKIKEFHRLRHQDNLEIKFQSHQSKRLGL